MNRTLIEQSGEVRELNPSIGRTNYVHDCRLFVNCFAFACTREHTFIDCRRIRKLEVTYIIQWVGLTAYPTPVAHRDTRLRVITRNIILPLLPTTTTMAHRRNPRTAVTGRGVERGVFLAIPSIIQARVAFLVRFFFPSEMRRRVLRDLVLTVICS